ncbi:Extradiol ring-cleavage dioxygenase class III protein subunit B [Sulfolobus islandicus Y.G.57.14]|jgi:aromatic ring-opening dioxygenase catalytic subunit (LigB family)|nr:MULTISPECIES: dioxygenase [Sulfolobaceae]ACP34982.1 Extradiol ring-cleavage dioxygenase class III protein subunit B [Sulfolobus islandicus L.S.2.15]ACP45280.1 Extradiol ring-cleavage dioxygenase class III protein subunit B [Sulfolobus islandicus Y.G.57.14]ACP48927.1 Extradiol ring-cleavage dioxygenase class III protein subunit B [Sulfolobus islandicus Y.N.15.51]
MTIGLFISHGSPTILIDENKWKDLLRRVGKEIEEKYKPETIIVSSPHFVSWTETFYIESSEKLECIQDYYDFPDETYKYCYNALNDTELVEEIVKNAEGKVVKDDKWGLDHGAWIPLFYMFPEYKPKVVTISITDNSPESHYEIGEKIRKAVEKLGRKAVFLATGSPTHRLDLFYFKITPKPTKFDAILMDLIKSGEFEKILKISELYPKEYQTAMPEGNLNTLHMLLGYIKPKKAEILGYDTPWPGVSMLAASFYE